MKIEDRLHEAMHDYADGIEPDAGSWSQIASRFDEPMAAPRRPTRRPLVLAGVAAAVVLVLIAGLLVRDGEDDGDNRIATTPSSGAPVGNEPPAPRRILAITTAGQPVMYESGTSRQIFQYEPTGMAEGTQIAVAPNGTDAYVVQGDGNKGCADHTIQRLAIGGAPGAEQVATNATDPAVSPDGRYLAYLHCSPDAGNRADHIVLRDLATGEERVTTAPAGTFFIGRVEFVGDAHRAVFNLFDEATGRATLHELDLVNGEAPPGRDVGAGAGQTVWVGLRGVTGDYLAVSASSSSPATVVSLTPPGVVPARSDVLFTLPGIPTQVASDRSGLHLLAVVDHALYEWSIGDKTATKIFDGGISGAAWVPDSPTQSTTSLLPNGVVVARNGALDVIGAIDGNQHSTLGSVDGVTAIGAAGDARELIYSFTGASPACGGRPGPTINRLDTGRVDPLAALNPQTVGSGPGRDTSQASTFLVGGSGSPAVSPDGEWVAYGIACDGVELGYTNLHTGANYRIDARPSTSGAPFPELLSVEPLAWAPDSEHLLYRLTVEGDATRRYYLGRVTPDGDNVDPVEIKAGAGIRGAAFIDDGTLALAGESDTGAGVWTFDLQTRAQKVMFTVPGKVASLVADPSGRHFLALQADGALYRWTAGDLAPTKLSDGVTAAVWTPWS